MKTKMLFDAWNRRGNAITKIIDYIAVIVLGLALVRGLISLEGLISPAWLAVLVVFAAPAWIYGRVESAWKEYQNLNIEQQQAREQIKQSDTEHASRN